MNPRKTADFINPLDCNEVFSKPVPTDPVELAPKSERLFKASVVVTCGWALIEAPLELGASINSTALLALMASKVLLCLIGAAAIADLRFARRVFTFICGASLFAIAPALPLEYTRCVALGLFSTVECLGKAACVASFPIALWTVGTVREHLSVGNRKADDCT
ncbi:hypothetical protein ACV229_33755 [Burkholderia sp. MR1-5-21]